jgi:hypothetical protein
MRSNNATGPSPRSRRGGLEGISLGPARPPSALWKRAVLSGKLVPSVFPVLALAFAVMFFRAASAGGYGTNYIYPLIMMSAVAVFGVTCLVTTWLPKRRKNAGPTAVSPASGKPDSAMTPASDQPAGEPAAVSADVAVAGAPAGDGAAGASPVAGNGGNNWLRGVAVLVWLILYVAMIPLLGMIVGGGVFTFGLMLSLGYRKPVQVAAIAIVLSVVVWVVFVRLFGVVLPDGIWG